MFKTTATTYHIRFPQMGCGEFSATTYSFPIATKGASGLGEDEEGFPLSKLNFWHIFAIKPPHIKKEIQRATGWKKIFFTNWRCYGDYNTALVNTESFRVHNKLNQKATLGTWKGLSFFCNVKVWPSTKCNQIFQLI